MKRVVFITSQYLSADRKAGFHFLAEAFWRAGWHVVFMTESLSWLSIVRRDPRCKYPLLREAGRLRHVRDRFASYVWMTPFHPIHLRSAWLNRLTAPILRLYGRLPLGEVEPEIKRADLFVFDSDHGLLLFDRVKRMNPSARCIYRVSDNIPMLGHHPLLIAQESAVLPRFDLVSVPSAFFCRRFEHLGNVVLQHHGLEKELFDRPCQRPFQAPGPHVVYVGKNFFDHDFLARAVRLFPDWPFHVFGEVGALPPAANLRAYGELPFSELVPYLKHADVGLQTLSYHPGAECFTDSLKMHQYTYCRLPIVAPAFLKTDRPHVFYYRPGDDTTIRGALIEAHAFDRRQVPVDTVLSWDEIARTWSAELSPNS